MKKRQNRSIMLFSLLFLLALVIAVGSFIYGVQIGVNKTEDRYKKEQKAANGTAIANPAQQQDLILFYNNVFSPYSVFQTKWLQTEQMLSQGKLAKAESEFNQLSRLAVQKYEEAGQQNLQSVEGLNQAQAYYLRSLKLFGQAADEAAATASKHTNTEIQEAITDSEAYKTAVKQELAGQQLFYDSMLKWCSSVSSGIPASYTFNPKMTLTEWNKLPLIIKNKLMADELKSGNKPTGFFPQDLASRIDKLVDGGQARRLKLATVADAVKLLDDTDSVRSGDFIDAKADLYAGELLPILPFF